MSNDKYTALWVSHSSMGNFLKCPRLYYLSNVYKDPLTYRRIAIVNPHFSLGSAVHEVLEGLGELPASERMSQDLLKIYKSKWQNVKGINGGFSSDEEENNYFDRGEKMLQMVVNNPRFLVNKCVKLPKNKMNPNFYLSEEENIILNGLVDWLEYLPDTDSLHIVDFKTGKNEEEEGSLQLPIYLLLCNALQKRPITKASYWYLETDRFVQKDLPNAQEAKNIVLDIAMKIKKARQIGELNCPKGELGCHYCQPFEKILKKEKGVEKVGVNSMNQDLYKI